MADTLVLASLSVDASALERGLVQSDKAIARTSRNMEQFGSSSARVGKSISSFTSGLRTLTLGYLSLATAHRAVASSLAFIGIGLNKVLDEEKKYFASTSQLVVVTEQLTKAQSDLQITLGRIVAGSPAYIAWLQNLSTLTQDIANTIKAFSGSTGFGFFGRLGQAAGVGARATERQQANRAILASVPPRMLQPTRPEAITDPKRLAQIHDEAEKLLDKARQQRFESEQNRMKSFDDAIRATNNIREAGLEVELQKMEERNKLQKEFEEDVKDTIILLQEGLGDPTRGGGFTDNWKTSLEVARESWDDFKTFVMDGIQPLQLAIASIQTAMGAFVSGMSEALLRGKFSFRQFMADMLASLVPVLLGYGALGLVAGFLGNPAGFKAAGIAFAAAVAAAAAARALGGGGVSERGSSGGAGGGAAAGAQGGPETERTLTIVFNNSTLMGTDPDNLARNIAKIVRTASADGA